MLLLLSTPAMDNLIAKIKDLEREAVRLKQLQPGATRKPPPPQPLLRQWSLQEKEKKEKEKTTPTTPQRQQQQQQQQRQRPPHLLSPPRPTAARSLQILENGLGSHAVARSYQLQESCEGDEGDGNWLAVLKSHAQPWQGKKLVVLSLFDGIGGIWEALTRLGIPFVGYSSEVFEPAVQVVKAKFPDVRHVGDVRRLAMPAIREEIDLVVGGFPCQDLSCLGKREGLHGSRSKLFFDLVTVIKDFKPRWFLVENVASMSWIDRDEICKYLRVQPLELDSIELSPTKRRRFYWTNLPLPTRLPRVRNHPSTFVQSCLHDALALEEKTGVVISSNDHEGNTCQLELVMEKGTNNLRYLNPLELERMMGYQPHHTNILIQEGACTDINDERRGKKKGGPRGTRMEPLRVSVRWKLLGNAFTVPVISYLLSPLLQRDVQSSKPINLPGPCAEEECAVMEPDDVWALYNQRERPNWYALITRRSGGRFSRKNQTNVKSKPPLCIEMRYMELVRPYLEGENDTWNPLRGTGLYELRQEVDVQDTWTAFSHRVTTFRKSFNKVFVYPGKDEVWSVYSRKTWSPFFVYVIESAINLDNLELAAHGFEGFYARAYVLIKTAEHELYRKTEKILEFFDLSVFCFRAPYHFKYEANLLKVEVGIKGRKLRKIKCAIRRESKRKRESKADQYSSEEDEDEEEEEDEVEAEDMVPARAKETNLEFPADDVHATGFLVEEPDQSGAMLYPVNRNDGDEPPYRQYADKDKGIRTSTPARKL